MGVNENSVLRIFLRISMGFENVGQTIVVKCALLGDAAVGKSAICKALTSDGAEFPKNYGMTTSVELSYKTLKIEHSDDEVCLILTDLGVQVPGYLVGNKNDINQDRQVITDKEAHKLAQELDLTYFKTSARENTGISLAFQQLSNNFYKNWAANPESVPILAEQ